MNEKWLFNNGNEFNWNLISRCSTPIIFEFFFVHDDDDDDDVLHQFGVKFHFIVAV